MFSLIALHSSAPLDIARLGPWQLNGRVRLQSSFRSWIEALSGYASKMIEPACPFCTLPAQRIMLSNQHGLVIQDGFPVSDGHALIMSRRHVGSYFDLNIDERDALLALLDETKRLLDKEFHPDGYNIGINDGPAAGQTIQHLHIHLIPRFRGDQDDPRGGVRWVIPEKANYWTPR